jgi:medium-chain acyl-[acyl-carrier-protein] hydrolase
MHPLHALDFSMMKMNVNDPDRWILRFKPRPAARLRLFCFPYAGGSASIYRDWAQHVIPEVEVIGIQPPGRESRISEPLIDDLPLLLRGIFDALRPHLDRPCLFFGHSLGALVSYEMARLLRDTDFHSVLRGLFVSGSAAPQLRKNMAVLHDLPDGEFIERLRALNGTPKDLFDYPELLELFLPILRNDFFLSEVYRHRPAAPLDIPIHCLGGEADPRVDMAQLTGWKAQSTHRPFSMTLFQGDHFFIHPERGGVIDLVNRVARQCLDDEDRRGA